MEKLRTSKIFLKMAGGRMHIPHPTPLDPPLVISYRNHQKSLAYYSHLAPLILFFFTKRQNEREEEAWHNIHTYLCTQSPDSHCFDLFFFFLFISSHLITA